MIGDLNLAGLTIAIIALALCVLIFVFNRQIRVVTKYYWFWLVIGLFLVIWEIVWRWIPYIFEYIDLLKTKFDPSTYESSRIISKALMLDLCPWVGLMLPLALVVDPSRKLARAIAPLAFIGGALVVFGQFTSGDVVKWGIRFFFIGDNYARLYVFMHFSSLILSLLVLLNTPKFGWKGYLSFVGVTAFFYCYVLVCMKITGCRHLVSGLTLDEWQPGAPYGIIAKITGWAPIICMCVCLPLEFLVASGFVTFNDYVVHRFKPFNYGNYKTYKITRWYDYNIHSHE